MAFVIAAALTGLGALAYMNSTRTRTTVVVSRVNGKKYNVVPSEDMQSAADTLAVLETRAKDFIRKVSEAFPNDSLKVSRWSGTISEIRGEGTIAYALDKTDIYMCIRDSNGVIQDIDDLFFVLLHELSHVSNKTYGHGDDFWKQFKRTLEIASHLGALSYKNYDKYHVDVCGKTISSNPMTCVMKKECFSELRPLRPR